MGRRPEGAEALSGAERQTRYRLRLAVALKQPPGRGHNPAGVIIQPGS